MVENEIKLEKELPSIEKKCNLDYESMSEGDIIDLADKKAALEAIRQGRLEGILLRSRSRYYNMGEKPTKYFFGLEKRSYLNKLLQN